MTSTKIADSNVNSTGATADISAADLSHVEAELIEVDDVEHKSDPPRFVVVVITALVGVFAHGPYPSALVAHTELARARQRGALAADDETYVCELQSRDLTFY